MNKDDDKKTTEDFLSFDKKDAVDGLERFMLDLEKYYVKKRIVIRSVNFGVIVVTGSLFALLGNNLVEKLILATPYALIGGRNLQIIDEQRYKIKCINQELKSLKR